MFTPVIKTEKTPEQIENYQNRVKELIKDEFVSKEYLLANGYVVGTKYNPPLSSDEYLCKQQTCIRFCGDEDYPMAVSIKRLSGLMPENGPIETVVTDIQMYIAGISKRELKFMELALNVL